MQSDLSDEPREINYKGGMTGSRNLGHIATPFPESEPDN
jgi:hypothetical protein